MTEVVYAAATVLSAIAAILAWTAKIRWSREYRDAVEQQIRAKDAAIEALTHQVASLRELNPVAIREYFVAVKTQLEEYIAALKAQLQEKSAEVEQKDFELKMVRTAGETHAAQVEQLRTTYEELNSEVVVLNEALRMAEQARQTASPLLDAAAEATASLQEIVDAFSIGQHVEVTDGPFAGLRGLVTEWRNKSRVLVSIHAIGQGLDIDMPSSALRPVTDASNGTAEDDEVE